MKLDSCKIRVKTDDFIWLLSNGKTITWYKNAKQICT